MNDFPFAIVGFDLDGTLLDTHRDLARAVNHALALEGRAAVPSASVRAMVGGGARLMLARALEATGGMVAPERFEHLHDALLEFYEANICVETALFPGGTRMLEALAARGVAMAVVTNKLERFAVSIIEQLGLAGRFFTVIGGDTLGTEKRKPAPDLLQLMIARAPISGPAAYIGDSSFDTRAAAAAGLPCVAVSFGFNDRPARDLGADAVIDHFDELVPVLGSLGS